MHYTVPGRNLISPFIKTELLLTGHITDKLLRFWFGLEYNSRGCTTGIITPVRGVHSSCSHGLPGGSVVRIHASAAGSTGSIPGQETKIPKITWPSQKKKNFGQKNIF